ncbi:hypothetical protein MERGE_001845 [Pneumocystis wakefieldiae]|uniref:Exportin-T n=1 Tax=Pneumocystis wakefieldiae TaxID=38082 RepID=A0A899FW61_9ASCO|nr:hypothetical protein MERGE_001845 [Pneumocystis wakefieldiae]
MEESIDQAINIALAFCDQIKNCPEGWQICLTLFTKIPKKSEQTRLFALQVLEYVVKSRVNELAPESIEFIKSQMFEWIKQEFSQITVKTIDPPCKISNLYIFYNHLNSSSQNGATYPEAAEFYLKILLSIHEEIADQHIPRKPDEIHRNNTLKNKIRQNDMHRLTDSWYRLMIEYQQTNKNIVELCMKVVGKYISWIDISLIVNNSYMSFIFGLLTDKQLRNIACETLVEIISKKMKHLDKLELIFLLNIIDHISKLNLSEDTDFTENLAKLINSQIIELVYIFGDNSLSKEAYLKVDALLFNTVPFLLRFLSDEYDETSSAVFPALTELLTLFRKQKKIGQIESSRKDLLESILNTLIMKTKYDESLDWLNDRKTDEYIEFLEMRKKLRTFQDIISSIDYNLYCNCILHLVTNGLEKAFSEANWRHLELILYEVFSFGEGLKVLTYTNNNDNNSPTVLGQLLGMIINSEVSSYPHPSIQLHYLEIAVRYASFFEYQPSLIPKVLETMLDHRGLRHHNTYIKKRAPYLFLKYLRLLSNRIENFSETTLEAIHDLLTIKLEPIPETNINNGINTDITPIKGLFESTFYLFEAAGLLISTNTSILEPLFPAFQKYLSSDRDNDVNVLYIYHIIMAIGSFSKGFPDTSRGSPSIDSISKTFLQASEVILVALETLKHKEIIREAARFSFARLTNILDLEILPKFPRLINGLLTESKTSELIDFLLFVGLLVHKFKSYIYDILNSLFMPLLNRIFQSLNESTEGTDEIIIQNDLRKKYLEFVLALMNNDLDTVCVSDINQPNFETFLRSIIHFAADISDPSTEKIAFSILNKMVNAWASDQSDISDIKAKKIVPGFDQFIFHSLSSLCFEVPSKQSFNPRDTHEISNLQFTIFKKKEVEFERYLYNIYFPSVNIPQEIAKEYVEALKQLNAKQFKTFFQNFISKLK